MAWLDQTVTSHLPEKAGPALLSELQKQIRSSEFFVVGLLHSFSGCLLSGVWVNPTFLLIVATFSRTIRATGHRICATEMTTTRSISNGTMTDLCKLVLFFLDFSTAGLFGHVLYQGHLIHLLNIHQGGKFGQNQSGGNSPAFVA